METENSNGAEAENIAPAEITSTNLYVGNIPYSARWQGLKDLFKQAGTFLRHNLINNQAMLLMLTFQELQMENPVVLAL
jgi:RNA recognition motif-containing protein